MSKVKINKSRVYPGMASTVIYVREPGYWVLGTQKGTIIYREVTGIRGYLGTLYNTIAWYGYP